MDQNTQGKKETEFIEVILKKLRFVFLWFSLIVLFVGAESWLWMKGYPTITFILSIVALILIGLLVSLGSQIYHILNRMLKVENENANFFKNLEKVNVELQAEINAHEETEQILRELATHDPLTGLPNRNLLLDRLQQYFAQARRFELDVVIMFIDLDNFKLVNDDFGHSVGDSVLRLAASRLNNNVRDSDTVARLGGDEFIIVFTMNHDKQDYLSIAEKIVSAFSNEPFLINDREVRIKTSIGISIYPKDAASPEILLANADTAMYQAKQKGGNQYQLFSTEMQTIALPRKILENELRTAMRRQEFILYYQPVLNIRTNHVVGVEALLRWNHPRIGIIDPGEFITVAEETGLIISIGEMVLRESCKQGKRWEDEKLNHTTIAVNLSGYQFRERDFVRVVAKILRETGLSKGRLELELRETSLIGNMYEIISTLTQLKELGAIISLGDFGTGYSSLSQLTQFPIDKIKIDRTLIRDIPVDKKCVGIVQAIIAIAENLGLSVVGEGIETREQYDFFYKNAVTELQGYYFYKPMPAEECTTILRRSNGKI